MPYAGYQDSPELQLQWFLDKAEAVKAARVADGLPVDDPKSYGEWIADVERPAEQYRGRYQLRLEEARALLDAASPEKSPSVPAAGNEAQVLKVIDPDAADSALALSYSPHSSSLGSSLAESPAHGLGAG